MLERAERQILAVLTGAIAAGSPNPPNVADLLDGVDRQLLGVVAVDASGLSPEQQQLHAALGV